MEPKEEYMKYSSLLLLVVLIFTFQNGCTSKKIDRFGIDPQAAVQAPQDVKDSIKGVTNNKNEYYLQLEKASLEKEFLLRVSLISQPQAPLGSSLKSRIVTVASISASVLYMWGESRKPLLCHKKGMDT